jgi:acyl-CoA synthetase (NDP forming)
MVASDPQIDFLVIHWSIDWHFQTPEDRKTLGDFTEVSIKIKKRFGKPIIAVLRSSQSLQSWRVFLEEQNRYLEGGIPVYSTLEDAVNAVSKLIKYYELRARY